MSYKSHFKIPNFFDNSKNFRKEFEEKFKNPLQTTAERFIWDYWYVPDQYKLIRTQAENIFSKNIFQNFQNDLIQFGRNYLGCDSITPPWISYYVDGCEQQLHADVPHGPWAYVYSLTPWSHRKFSGGETILLKNSTLDYWNHFEQMNGIEMNELTEKIPALFNQLLVFDPRIPHGVKQVRGVEDPLQARVVIHGWFTNPQPTIEGGLARTKSQKEINQMILDMQPIFANFPDITGTLTLRFEVLPNGKVSKIYNLTNTLISLKPKEQKIKYLTTDVETYFKNVGFPKSNGKSYVTIPFLFQTNRSSGKFKTRVKK